MSSTSRLDRRMITNYIEKLLREAGRNSDLLPVLLHDAELHRLDDGNIQLRIPATFKSRGETEKSQLSRYFLIKVSEQM